MSSRGANDDKLLDEIRVFVNGRPAKTIDDTDPGDDGLEPARLRAALHSYERGSFPSNSMPEAISRSSEPPYPEHDATDRKIIEARIGYSRALAEAHRQLRTAMAIQNAWLLLAPEVPADPEPERAPVCINGPCDNDAEPDRPGQYRKLCSRCRKYKQRTQRDWAPTIELRDNVVIS